MKLQDAFEHFFGNGSCDVFSGAAVLGHDRHGDFGVFHGGKTDKPGVEIGVSASGSSGFTRNR